MIWDPKEYGNITQIQTMSTNIWLPDLMLYNSADELFDKNSNCLLLVSHDGSIRYLPPSFFSAFCEIKIEEFPFDEQTCKLKFGS